MVHETCTLIQQQPVTGNCAACQGLHRCPWASACCCRRCCTWFAFIKPTGEIARFLGIPGFQPVTWLPDCRPLFQGACTSRRC